MVGFWRIHQILRSKDAGGVMKKIQFADSVFGPYQSVEVLDDRYHCDGADLPFSVVGQGLISDAVESDFPEPTMSQEEIQQLGTGARSDRNRLLTESDWTQVLDAPVDQNACAIYRQALRDIPQQEGFPTSIDWPVKP
jgi:hypothetical protein